MRHTFMLIPAVFLFFAGILPAIRADSQQAYQDYLYQSDVYRQKYADFQVAKNEYDKFKSLTSQSTAVDKTRQMLSVRDLLLRSYLLLLNEKLNEDKGLPSTQKQLYQTLIQNEVAFLETHSSLVTSIESLNDATRVSTQLESHYLVLARSIRQTIVGVGIGKLLELGSSYDAVVTSAKAIVDANRGAFSPQKQATIDRWLLQIANKKSLFQQKIDTIQNANASVRGDSIAALDRAFSQLQQDVAEAKQELAEGSLYLTELVNSLSYQE